MSKRRRPGDWVWLAPNTGFVGRSHEKRVEIQPEPDHDQWACTLGCGDPECVEWSTLLTEPDWRGRRGMLCHVSECQMRDAPVKQDDAG